MDDIAYSFTRSKIQKIARINDVHLIELYSKSKLLSALFSE